MKINRTQKPHRRASTTTVAAGASPPTGQGLADSGKPGHDLACPQAATVEKGRHYQPQSPSWQEPREYLGGPLQGSSGPLVGFSAWGFLSSRLRDRCKMGPPTHPPAARRGLVEEVFSTRSFLYFSFAFVKPASGRGSEHLSLKAHGEL